MALLRKDLKIGFLAGAAILLLGVVYVVVLTFTGPDTPQQASADDLAGIDTPLPQPTDDNAAPAGGAVDVPLSEEAKAGLGMLANAAEDDWGASTFSADPHITDTPTPGAGDAELPDQFVIPTTDIRQPDPLQPVADPATGGAPLPATATDPAPAGTPLDGVLSGVRTHVVANGESFSSIAQNYYGDANLFGLIQKANPNVKPKGLRVGQKLIIPPHTPAATTPTTAAPTEQPAAGAVDANVHIVAPGETLSLIAAKRLGRAALWEELYKLNKDVIGGDPGNLKVGMKLRLPQ